MTYYPLIALAAVFLGVWGFGRWADRRFKRTLNAALARLNGRFEAGGPFNGGTLYGKLGERDVVISFQRASSKGPEYTYVSTILKRAAKESLLLIGPDVVARVPGLKPWASWTSPTQLRVESTQLTVRVHRIQRSEERLMALAGLMAAFGDELDANTA